MFSKHSKFFRKVFLAPTTFLPTVAFALNPDGSAENLTEFIDNFIRILNPIILFVAGLCFFGFLLGVLKYTGAGVDEERLGKAKQLIVYGLVGMLVLVSFWGLARILAGTYLMVGV